MTNLDIYKVLRSIILAVTDVPKVIYSNPNATAPDGDYCAVSIEQPVRQRGQANIYSNNVIQDENWIGVKIDVRPQLIVDASVNFYRGNAHEYARKLFQANKRPDIQSILFKNKIGWNSTSAINNLTALQSSNWEERAQLNVRLMFEDTNEVDVNAIYNLSVVVEDEKGDIIEQIDLNT